MYVNQKFIEQAMNYEKLTLTIHKCSVYEGKLRWVKIFFHGKRGNLITNL